MLFLAHFAFADDSNLGQMEKNGIVVPGSSSFHAIYDWMVSTQRFPNLAGHTMAAGVLASCRAADKQKLNDWVKILDGMAGSLEDMVGADGRSNPQISYAAAVLTCKIGKRSHAEMVTRLELTFRNLKRDGKADWLPNVVAAAELVQ